jgi:hypothetical protein
MKRTLLATAFLIGCSSSAVPTADPATDTIDSIVQEEMAPPEALTIAPFIAYAAQSASITISGGAVEGETAYLAWSAEGLGEGPCFRPIGDQCVGLLSPRLAGSATVDEAGIATVEVSIPDAPGASMALQAWIVRGWGGVDSFASEAATQELIPYIVGCTDPAATDYNPDATFDDGTCTYPAPEPEGYYSWYSSEGRSVYAYMSDPATPLTSYDSFCEDHGLTWFAPTSAADAQLMIDTLYSYDAYHTWIVTKNTVVVGAPLLFGGYAVTVDGPDCVEGSDSGFSGIRKVACSSCDPDLYGTTSCWDGHGYDWLVCQG